MQQKYIDEEWKFFNKIEIISEKFDTIQKFTYEISANETEKEVYEAMEVLLHNLNTMYSRAGAQTPFLSVNYGIDTSL